MYNINIVKETSAICTDKNMEVYKIKIKDRIFCSENNKASFIYIL